MNDPHKNTLVLNKQKRSSPLYFVSTVLTLLIVFASVILYLPVFNWLLLKMSLANGYLHIFAILGLISLGVYRLFQLRMTSTINTSPSNLTLPSSFSNYFHFPVLLHSGAFIWITASVLYLLNESNVGFHTLSAALFIVYLYGLAGHFLSKLLWRSLLIPMLLLILVLPFEHYLDIYLGFPLRLLSAQWAGSVLQIAQLPMLTVESILMIDNKAAIVDLDCSGINSLWIGMIFYLLLTWIERYVMNRRWVVIGLVLAGLLVLSNVFRIVILVLLDLVFELPELAKMIHQSLGLLGFIISCLIVWWLLQKLAVKKENIGKVALNADKPNELNKRTPDKNTVKKEAVSASVIIAIIMVFIALYQPQQLTASTVSPSSHSFSMSDNYALKKINLNPQEKTFFLSNKAEAQKYNVELTLKNGKNVTASMVFVWSRAWKTHHVPENCYLSQGYSISNKGLWFIKPEHPLQTESNHIRYLALDKPNTAGNKQVDTSHQTGAYWFQSYEKSTPDYSSRVLDNFLHPNREWVMVSILWDSPVNPDEIRYFINNIKHSIESQLHED